VLLYFLLHVPIGIALRQSSQLGAVHAALTTVVGFYLALSSRRPFTTALVGAYLVGSELLWRMARVPVFWEFGKYLTVVLFLVSMVRTGAVRFSPWPLLYFLALIPSTVITFMNYDWHDARRLVSADLSGPLALMVAACFFTGMKLPPPERLRLLIAVVGPIVGALAIAMFSTLTAGAINFTNNSNYVTSGRYGPNQVSGMFSLGALACFLLLMLETPPKLKGVFFGLLALFLIQSTLTFSRGGLYIASISCVAASFFLFRDKRARLKLIVLFGGVLALALVVVVPMLDRFTQGALTARYKNTQLTKRDQLAAADLEIWLQNPLLGVGTGQAAFHRGQILDVQMVASHTEFARLLAEHGVFGIGAGLLLFFMAWNNLRRARSPLLKATVVAAMAWAFLFMAGSGMRLVAPSFMFGLSFATFLPAAALVRRPVGAAAPAGRVAPLLRPTPGQSPA
jgi:O-antigen ligase